MTTAVDPGTRRQGRLAGLTASPVLFVFLLAPILGELLSSSMPLPEFLVGWLPMAVLYGCGALLIREAAVRWGTGWAAIVLLGLAYGIYEEGIVVRSFFDPAWQDLGALGTYGRAAGVNWLWAELLSLFHAAVPVASTLLIAEVVFPDRKGEPWLTRRGLLWCGLGLAVWTPIGAAALMDASGAQMLATTLVIGGLVLAARMAPVPLFRPRAVLVPRPRWFFAAGLAATAIAFLGIYLPAEASLEAPGSVVPAWVTGVAVLAGVGVVAARLIRRSGGAASWDDRHRTALVWGILAFMSLLTAVAGGVFGPAVAAATTYAMWRVHRRAGRAMAGAPV